jgi:BON domain-containing protein
MNKALLFGAGVGLGTGLMFLLDPARGKRRRALVRDKWNLALRKTGECMEITARDVSNRTRGLVADIQGRLNSEPVEDSVLVDRVRSRLGRVVSHPGVIEVTAQDGKVTLSGPVLASEAAQAASCVSWVRGVNDVVNNLEVHEATENHPALQGGRERQGSRFELFQENWSPTARLLAGAAGASLAVYGGTRRNALGAGLGAAGLLLMTRGITNANVSHLIESAKQMGGRSERAALTQ